MLTNAVFCMVEVFSEVITVAQYNSPAPDIDHCTNG